MGGLGRKKDIKSSSSMLEMVIKLHLPFLLFFNVSAIDLLVFRKGILFLFLLPLLCVHQSIRFNFDASFLLRYAYCNP